MVQIGSKINVISMKLARIGINSAFFLILSVLFQSFAIVLILGPNDAVSSITNQSKLSQNLYIVREYMYFLFETIGISKAQYIGIVSALVASSSFYIYFLVCKQQWPQAQYYIKVFYNFQQMFGLPLSTIFIYGIKNLGVLTGIVCTFIYILFALVQYLSSYLKFVCICNSSCKSDKYFDWLEPLVKLVLKLILLYTICRDPVTLQERVVISVLIVGLHLALIIKLIDDKIQRYYSVLEAAHYFSWVVVTCYYLVVILELAVELVQDNRWLMLGSLVVWSTLSVHNVLEHSKNELLIKPVDKIATEKQAIAYIRLLCQVFFLQQQYGNSLLFLGLVKSHINDCTNINCICKKQIKQQDQQLKKEKKSNHFYSQFLEMSFKILADKFQTKQTEITFLAFEVIVMEKYPIYFYESDLFKKQQQLVKITLSQKFALVQIQNEALKQANEKGRTQQINNQSNCKMFTSQSKIDECYIKMEKIVLSFTELFIKNARNHCSLDLLKKQLGEIYTGLIEIRTLFGDEKVDETISLQLALLMLFFYRGVFNFSFYVKPILKRLQWLNKRSDIRQLSHDNFDISMFSQKGCVIESTLQSKVFGTINKVSLNAAEVFNYPSNDSMLNLDIGRLLPSCFRDEHRRILEKWVEVGSYRNINRLIQTFCLSYPQNLFKVLIRAQIAVIGSKIAVFVGVVKLDEHSYMIINKKGEVDSYGLDFKKFMNRKGKQIHASQVFSDWDQILLNISSEPITIKTPFIIVNKSQSSKNQPISTKNFANCLSSKDNDFRFSKQMLIQANSSYFKKQKFYIIRKMANFSFMQNPSSYVSLNHVNEKDDNFLRQSSIIPTKLLLQKQKNTVNIPDISSTQSSSKDINFSIEKLYQSIQKRATNTKKLNSPCLIYTAIAIIIVSVLVLATIGTKIFIVVRSLASFNEVIFADAAVSDNMQLLLLLYNNILSFEKKCKTQITSEYCKTHTALSIVTQNQLTQLFALDIEVLLKNVTFYNNKYYFYKFTQVNLTIEKNVTRSVPTFQFMKYFVASSKKMINMIKQNNTSNQYLKLIEILKHNWQPMKKINHDNIKAYEQVGIQQIQTANRIIYIISMVYWILVTLHVLILYAFWRKNQQLVTKVLILYRYIPITVSTKLQQYYNNLSIIIKSRNLSAISQIEQIHPQFANQKIGLDYTIQRKIFKYVKLIIIWFSLVSLNVIITYNIIQLNKTSESIIGNIGQLMDSENYMLENYFQLKQLCLYEPVTEQSFQKFNNLVNNFNNTLNLKQNQFVKTALEATTIIAQLDLGQAARFSQLVSQNICEKLNTTVGVQQLDICQNAMKYELLEDSIITVMTFLQSTILSTAYQIRDQFYNKSLPFKQKIFQDLDRYLYYAFRMFQATQTVMMEGLSQISNYQMLIIILVIIAQLCIQAAIVVFWFYKLQEKRAQSTQGYAYALAYPVCIAKCTKYVQQSLINLL